MQSFICTAYCVYSSHNTVKSWIDKTRLAASLKRRKRFCNMTTHLSYYYVTFIDILLCVANKFDFI